MNQFYCIDTFHIRSSRTIDTIYLNNSFKEKVLYIYNYEGYSYRVFENILCLIEFFNTGTESKFIFESERKLDNFLKNYIIQ